MSDVAFDDISSLDARADLAIEHLSVTTVGSVTMQRCKIAKGARFIYELKYGQKKGKKPVLFKKRSFFNTEQRTKTIAEKFLSLFSLSSVVLVTGQVRETRSGH